MSSPDTQHKIRLEALLSELTHANQQAKASAATVDLDQSRVGRLTRMDALQNQAISTSAVNQREQQIRDIKSALRRLDAGNYGLCEACDGDINPLRLEHNPAARLCIQCAQAAEQG